MFALIETIIYATLLVVAVSYLLHRAFVPRSTIPGIPYHHVSRNTFLGDLPRMLAHGKLYPSTWYFHDQCKEQNTPIMQFWIRPFARPWVVVTDGREGYDVMTRRTKTFDRSRELSDAFRAYVPGSQITQPTGSDWKYNRRLVSDTMLPGFLDNVAAERVSDAMRGLVALWREKMRLAPDHTFECRQDLHFATTDAIWAMTFGTEGLATCKEQTSHLASLSSIRLPTDIDTELVAYPAKAPPAAFEAIKLLTHSSKIAIQFGYKIHAVVLNVVPRYRKARATRDALVRERLVAAEKKFTAGVSQESKVTCAVDLVVQREIATATKENRKPMTPDMVSRIHNELCLFLFAGATTTADTLAWGLKELSLRQDYQKKIRDYMKGAHPKMFEEGRQPPANALGRPGNPYLEALMYEVMRRRPISCGHFRIATENTQLLGHDIPKDTEVIFATAGPSFVSPAIPVDDSLRSETSRASDKDRLRKWDQQDLDRFRPERWLATDDDGDAVFDPTVAPMLAFGEGPRGCFGQKFAMLEMRIFYSLIFWNFELNVIHSSLMDFKAVEELTINPESVRVKLSSAR